MTENHNSNKMTEGVTSPLRSSALFAFSYVAWKT